jgi:hypothetical protein
MPKTRSDLTEGDEDETETDDGPIADVIWFLPVPHFPLPMQPAPVRPWRVVGGRRRRRPPQRQGHPGGDSRGDGGRAS